MGQPFTPGSTKERVSFGVRHPEGSAGTLFPSREGAHMGVGCSCLAQETIRMLEPAFALGSHHLSLLDSAPGNALIFILETLVLGGKPEAQVI